MIDVTKYSQIPYKDRGRSFDGCDCYGLAILIHRVEYGREISDVFYPTAENPEAIAELIDTMRPTIGAKIVRWPEEGDLVLMCMRGELSHIGVYLGNQMCIHTSRHYGTCCERLDGPRLRGRIEGYYRVA